MIKKFIFIFVSFTFSSCSLISPKWSNTYGENSQPIRDEFKMNKQASIYSNLIDTNAVYVSENEWVFSNKKGNLIAGKTIRYNYMIRNYYT